MTTFWKKISYLQFLNEDTIFSKILEIFPSVRQLRRISQGSRLFFSLKKHQNKYISQTIV